MRRVYLEGISQTTGNGLGFSHQRHARAIRAATLERALVSPSAVLRVPTWRMQDFWVPGLLSHCCKYLSQPNSEWRYWVDKVGKGIV